ncbi:MAG: hypothetical protein FJ388_17655 [Verrucomicrobia bacterium]|nr:hypothetical protein [Verrucomicrobiota bacterium]
MKKGCLIGAAVGIGLVAFIVIGIVAFVFWLTGGVVDAGNKFLSLLGEGRTQEAYLAADAALRSSQTEQEFTRIVKELSLTEYASASWRSRSMENNVATLEGTVQTRGGGHVPLTMKLIKQAGGWKVLSLEGPKAGATISREAKQVPPEDELRKLADKTLLDFNAAIQAKSFAKFYETISALWKSQITAEKFQSVFQEFIIKQINLSAIEGVAPVYDEPPSINSDGVLVLSGYYPAKTLRVTFRLKFVYEHPEWRLFGINVSVKET